MCECMEMFIRCVYLINAWLVINMYCGFHFCVLWSVSAWVHNECFHFSFGCVGYLHVWVGVCGVRIYVGVFSYICTYVGIHRCVYIVACSCGYKHVCLFMLGI